MEKKIKHGVFQNQNEQKKELAKEDMVTYQGLDDELIQGTTIERIKKRTYISR